MKLIGETLKSYPDLRIWQEAMNLAEAFYQIRKTLYRLQLCLVHLYAEIFAKFEK